jgi:hypothetical protein
MCTIVAIALEPLVNSQGNREQQPHNLNKAKKLVPPVDSRLTLILQLVMNTYLKWLRYLPSSV